MDLKKYVGANRAFGHQVPRRSGIPSTTGVPRNNRKERKKEKPQTGDTPETPETLVGSPPDPLAAGRSPQGRTLRVLGAVAGAPAPPCVTCYYTVFFPPIHKTCITLVVNTICLYSALGKIKNRLGKFRYIFQKSLLFGLNFINL